jgi:hypothetical protein
LRIDQHGYASHVRYVEWWHDEFAAQFYVLLRRGVYVVNEDSGSPLCGMARFGAFHHAADQAPAFLEENVFVPFPEELGFPAKQASVELSGRGDVGAASSFQPNWPVLAQGFSLITSHLTFFRSPRLAKKPSEQNLIVATMIEIRYSRLALPVTGRVAGAKGRTLSR